MKSVWKTIMAAVILLLASAVVFAGGQSEGKTGGSAAAGGAPDRSVELKTGHIFPTNHVTHRSLEAMAEYVEKESGGSLKISIFPLGQLGTGSALSQNIMLGTVDMGTAGPGLLSTLEPSFGVWGAEFMFKDVDAMFRVIDSDVGQEIFERLRKGRDLRVLGVGYLGQRHLTTSRTPVRTPADMRGLKIRIPDIPYRRAAFIAMGSSPTPMSFQELYLGLQQGVVDGQENPLPQIQSMKFFEVQRYLILTGHAQNPEMLIINEQKYGTLSDSQKRVLQEGAKIFASRSRELQAQEDDGLLQQLKAQGMTVIEPDVAAFRDAVRDVPQQFASQWGSGLYERIQRAQQ